MLEPCGDNRGQKRERLAVRSRQQEREDGELGEVELEIPYHPLECAIRNFYFRKVEGQICRANLAALHRTGDAIIAEQSAESGPHVNRVDRRRTSDLCRPAPCACRRCPDRARPS